MKLVVLSLRKVNDKVIINYDLTGKLTDFFNHNSPTLEIKLESGTIYLSKWAYLNNYKIFQSPIDKDCAFMVFSYKKPQTKLVLKMLLEHQQNKHKILKIKSNKNKKVAA